MVVVQSMVLGNLETNCYIVDYNGHIAVIDPAAPQKKLLGELAGRQGRVEYILLTHGHFDHIGGVDMVKEAYPDAEVIVNAADYGMIYEFRLNLSFTVQCRYKVLAPARQVTEGDVLRLGYKDILVMHTPGHSPGSTCYSVDDLLFCGDTIFQEDCGRSDLPGGNKQELRRSLSRISSLPPKTRLYCGHGPETTVAHEIAVNPYL